MNICFFLVSDEFVKGSHETAVTDDSDSEIDEEKLLSHIQKKVARGRLLCTQKNDQNVI